MRNKKDRLNEGGLFLFTLLFLCIELKTYRVHTEALACGVGAVIEHMTEMRVTFRAEYLVC